MTLASTMGVGQGSARDVAAVGTHMKLLIICFVSSELLEFAKLMKEQ